MHDPLYMAKTAGDLRLCLKKKKGKMRKSDMIANSYMTILQAKYEEKKCIIVKNVLS